ncbi:TetR/AcrR family transcriptional regulator [Nocardia sp. NEAU-G5]|uniref:TetR/AcrR family transcriptional regulator n=1 Tax=Nocardia albiluteola TaxID=2842303 RepID=A0ABS6B2F9_9NOCA|nr:TetR/AcrR family transcriptional regulator [Nocardia albiluteola]MBU3064487.1 TetR/AcrR family transcriptional regulator [Nocardia albiluteola]
MTATTPRARARARTMEDIVRIGREHLAIHGAAALSLRAVARDLGVVSSAVYRYVRSRDELLTLLVVDGYSELADAVDAALAAAPDDPLRRFRAVARALREWAVAEPARYGLLYGTPVPGYEAPAEQTVAPGVRVVGTMLQIAEAAYRTGALTAPDPEPPVAEALSGDLGRIRDEMGIATPDWVLTRAISVWSGLIGAVSAEVFEMFGGDSFTDPADVFEHQIGNLAAMLGFSAPFD